ncbi:helix-turn-helix domain-containing protein [Maribacter sp. 2307ULW6-5]|uniref:helix-turn-helix domain-containing protein n=1 Tax=Maribacter sp. 2307ULW6-5 TaxID=3386275 RepID=UPI0039BCE036
MKQPALGHKITELRKQKGLTQEELVERCNINVRTLQRIENGEVSPRSYTVRTILSALDHDYESVFGTRAGGQGGNLDLDNAREGRSVRLALGVAAIAGALYLLLGTFEGLADYYRFWEDHLFFGRPGHVAIKVLSFISFAIFIYGFLVVGKLFQNYLMKIATVIMAVVLLLFYGYDIGSLFLGETFPVEGILVAASMVMGTLGLLFGISILKSAKRWGVLGYVAGGFEVLTALFFLTVVLAPVGLFSLFPTVVLEIVLLVRTRQMVAKAA